MYLSFYCDLNALAHSGTVDDGWEDIDDEDDGVAYPEVSESEVSPVILGLVVERQLPLLVRNFTEVRADTH